MAVVNKAPSRRFIETTKPIKKKGRKGMTNKMVFSYKNRFTDEVNQLAFQGTVMPKMLKEKFTFKIHNGEIIIHARKKETTRKAHLVTAHV